MDAVTQPPRAARRPLHPLVRMVLAVLALLVLAYAFLWITKGRFLKRPFERIASAQAERPVRISGDFQLYLNPNIKFRAEGLSVANPAWAERDHLVTARLIDTEIALLPLIFRERRVRFLIIDRGSIGLEWNAKRQNTWTFGADTGEPLELPAIARAAITGTTIRYRDPALDLVTDVQVENVAARDTRLPDRIAFTGRGTSRGAPFALSGAVLSPHRTLAGGDNRLEARIDVGTSRIDVSGRLRGAFDLEGSDLDLRLRGANIATPFTLLGIVVPGTRRYDISADLTKAGFEWRLTRIRGRFGDSDLAGRATFSLPAERLRIEGDLSSRTLDITDVGPWLGISPEALDARGGDALITEVSGAPRIIPDAPLASESLARFDARVRYRAARVRTGAVPIADLSLGVDLNDRLLKLSPVDFDVSGGRVTAAFTINARARPVVTDYDIRLSPVPLGQILTNFDVENSGTSLTMRGRLQLRGYGDTMHKSLASSTGRIAIIFPRGTLWVRNLELAELDVADFLEAAISKDLKKAVTVRCGLTAFTVRDGIARADPIFIDTDRNIIRGEGGFSFKDESIDLKVEADSKNFSLFSAQSPIRVNGYLAEPGVNPISGKLIGRAVAAIGLGIVASPIASIAAFVDLGDEADTDCRSVLAAGTGAEVKRADGAAEKRKD